MIFKDFFPQNYEMKTATDETKSMTIVKKYYVMSFQCFGSATAGNRILKTEIRYQANKKI
jgi:hypothetical protein